MACKYTYKGKTYEAWEFVDVLASLPREELAKYLPDIPIPNSAFNEVDENGDPSQEESRFVENGISGKDPIQVAQWLADHAPARYASVAAAVREKLQSISDSGVKLGMAITYPGGLAEAGMVDARGGTFPFMKDGSLHLKVVVNGSGITGRVGTSFRTVLHELVHASTVQALRAGEEGDSRYERATRDLYDVAQAVLEYTRTLPNKEKLTEFEQSLLDGRVNMLRNVHEVVAWALSSQQAQEYLDSIPYKNKSIWTAFVEAIRKALGLSAANESALSEILRTSEILLRPTDPYAIFGNPDMRSRPMVDMPTLDRMKVNGYETETQHPGGGYAEAFPGGMPDVAWTGSEPLASIPFNPSDYTDKFKAAAPKIASAISDTFNSNHTFNWWHETLGSQAHKAQVDEHFKRVYDAATNYEGDTARFASEAADLAPDLVPKMDTFGDALKQAHFIDATRDFNAISPWVFYSTLAEVNLLDPANAHYLTHPDALIAKYGNLLPKNQPLKPLTERQIGLMKQYRDAVNFSLDTLAKTEMTRLAKTIKFADGSQIQMADSDMSLTETAQFYFDQIASDMEAIEGQILERQQAQKEELQLLEEAATDEASSAEKRKVYAKLLIEKRESFKKDMEPLMSKLEEYKSLKDGFVGKAAQVQKIKSEGYAPLMRFGKYTVDVTLKGKDGNVVKDNDGNEIRYFFGMFESESEANAIARELQEEYPDATITQGILSEYKHSLFKGISPETAEAYARIMGMESDEAFQKYLKLATSNRSAMKRLIHRKGTAGFSFDVTRNLASFITSNARASAANLHMGEMMKAVSEIPNTKGDVQDEAIKLLDFVRNPQEKGLAIRSLMFVQFLGGSISSAAVNLTQTFTTTLPYLSQEKFGGPKKAASAISSAMKMAGSRTFKKNHTTGNAELDRALKLAEEEGIVSPHEMHMLMGESSRGASKATNNIVWRMLENKFPALRYSSRLLEAMSAGWGSLFSLAERYNRQVSFIAAYNLAKERGESAEQAFEAAKQAVTETQFAYSKSARPNWGRSAVGATMLTFKSFLIQYSEFLVRMGKNDPKALGVALATLFLLAGVQGLPLLDDLDDIIDTLRQAAGYRGNSKEWKREILADVFGNEEFGKAATNFMLHGVSAFMPLDISGRLSVGNMIPATGILKKSDKDFGDDTLEVIGPVGSFIKKGIEAVRAKQAGIGTVDAYMENVAPKAISDVWKAIDMYQTGAYRDYKGRKIVDVSGGDVFWKGIGFQPNSVAEVRRVERLLQQDISLYRNTKTDLLERLARGRFERDPEKVARAKEQMAEWNSDNPDRQIEIKQAQMLRRVNEMNKLSSQRIVKAAPKDIRASVSSVLKVE